MWKEKESLQMEAFVDSHAKKKQTNRGRKNNERKEKRRPLEANADMIKSSNSLAKK